MAHEQHLLEERLEVPLLRMQLGGHVRHLPPQVQVCHGRGRRCARALTISKHDILGGATRLARKALR